MGSGCRFSPAANTPFGRTLPLLTKWFPPLSRGWHCPQGVLLARRRIRHPCYGRWSSGCFGFTWGLVEFRKMLWRLPPIHFGKEDGVERTLLRVACQSEPFLASPWQGGASIRFLWHIGCQSDFDEHFRGTSRIRFKICSPRQKLLTSRQKKFIETRRNRK